jgi:NTP pyrophosphatase (non-canonical NTP hydrolase)
MSRLPKQRKSVGPLFPDHSRGTDRPLLGSGRVCPMSDLTDLRDRMRHFTDERGWAQFHDPKSLTLALVGEVGELAELLQWLPAESALDSLTQEPLATRAAEEISDVLLYLVRLADVLGIDLPAAANRKLDGSEDRFRPSDYFEKAPEKT